MRRLMLFLVAVGLGVTTTGCGVVSEHPLSDPGAAKPEPALYGSWYHESPKGKPVRQRSGVFLNVGQEHFINGLAPRRQRSGVFLYVGKAGQIGEGVRDANFKSSRAVGPATVKYPKDFGGLMRAVWVQRSADGRLETESWVFFPTHIGDHWYANIPFYRNDGTRAGYRIARFDLSKDKLALWLGIASDQCKKAITSGKVRGVVPDGGDPWLDDSPENLRRFLKNGGDKLLFPDKEKIVFRRLKP